jgi:DNA-binding response OmpR family regulator
MPDVSLSVCYNNRVSTIATEPVKASILIVDDDEGVTHSFARMLRLEGFNVRTAVNAEAGLLEATSSNPDAIILDLRMPILDGLGFLRRLRSYDQHRLTPVAIVTGDIFLEKAVAAELQSLGAQIRYKPLWLDDLVDLAHSLVKVAR